MQNGIEEHKNQYIQDPTVKTLRSAAILLCFASPPNPSSPHPPSIQIMAARSKAISLLIFFGILFLCSLATTTSATSVESDAEVDYLYLTLKWPGTACKLGRCCMPTTGEPAMDFLVEDMKTYDSRTGKVVENCEKYSCKFNVRPIRDLISDLYSHWSDMGCPCNNGLQNWKHTWCTYGNCSSLNQHDYIQTALNITARANMLDVFEANDIVPSASTTYKLEDIQRALQANLGSGTYLECYNRGWIFPTSMLYKINICISKNGKSIIGCPFTKETTCRDNVMFYPFTSNMLQPCSRTTSSASLIKMPTEQDLAM